MNKKAILGLMLAIVMPFTGYWLVKYYSEAAVQMPQRYFFDSIAVIEKNGKTSTDTIWHRVKDMHFTNQLGKAVTHARDLEGRANLKSCPCLISSKDVGHVSV